ncbi:MAG: SpoIIIAC/SpoIIIAD family protein [Roseburia sp.]
MDIFKVGMMGITGVLTAVLLQKEKKEYSFFISLAIAICIFMFMLSKIETLLTFIEKMESMVMVDSRYILLIMKMIGISYAAEFAVGICKDAGYSSIAGQIETFAKISILVISIPVLTVFLETLEQFL